MTKEYVDRNLDWQIESFTGTKATDNSFLMESNIQNQIDAIE